MFSCWLLFGGCWFLDRFKISFVVDKGMEINDVLIRILRLLNSLKQQEIHKYLRVRKDQAIIGQEGHILVTINSDSIKLLNKHDVQERIVTNSKRVAIDLEPLKIFLTKISNFITRLNHVGISYSCDDIQVELAHYKRMLKNSGFKLYEEESGSPNS